MNANLEAIKQEIIAGAEELNSAKEVYEFKKSYLDGKTGNIGLLMKEMKNIAPEERAAYGKGVNELKEWALEFLGQLDEQMKHKELLSRYEAEKIDITLPAEETVEGYILSLQMLTQYNETAAQRIRRIEDDTDHYEDILGTYLTQIARSQISDDDSSAVSNLLKAIGDFERISDHSVNILESVEELREKKIILTEDARKELDVLCGALKEILEVTLDAFIRSDLDAAASVEPLEQVIDHLKTILRNRHIARLKENRCSVEAGFVWSDLLTDMERTSDHCSNIAIGILDASAHNMNAHQALRSIKEKSTDFLDRLDHFARKYTLTQQ